MRIVRYQSRTRRFSENRMNRYKMPVRSFHGVPFRTLFVVSMALVSMLVPSVRIRALEGFATQNSGTGRQDVPVVTLQTSEAPVLTDGPTSALVGSPNEDETVYMVNGLTGEVAAYQGGPDPSYRPFADIVGSLAVGSRDSIAYIDGNSKVVLAEPKGRILGKFNTPPAISLAVLRNGNVVVASPTEKHFLHLYSPTGQFLRSFGRLKKHGQVDHAEVHFLHKGKLLVDAADNIYYVYHYLPLVQKFSSDGVLKLEIDVQGDAVSLQQELAQRFFSNRKPNTIGGITIINSGAIDWRTGHLWLGLNGSSITGMVYEYDASGEKLTEYALVAGASTVPQVILGAEDIAVTRSKLYVLTGRSQGSHVFSFVRRVS